MQTAAFPLFLLLFINVLSVYIGLTRWLVDDIHHENIAITTIWCLFNTWLGLMALGAFNGKRQIRNFHRIDTQGKVVVYFPSAGVSKLGELQDISASGMGFKMELDDPPNPNEIVNIQVRDSYGNDYSFRGTIPHVRQQNGSYLCGAQFLPEEVSSPEVISFMYGDSERWMRMWTSPTVGVKSSSDQLTHFTKLGYRIFFTNLDRYLLAIKNASVKLMNKITQSSYWSNLISIIVSWLVYFLYLIVVAINGMLEQNKVRKFPRLYRDDHVSVYFPRIDAFLVGKTADTSLTGIGIKATHPFNIIERENVLVSRVDANGETLQLKCVIRKVIKRNDGTILGAEFIVDFSTYMDVVRFVYGNSATMIYSLTVGNLKNILNYLFFNPEPPAAGRDPVN